MKFITRKLLRQIWIGAGLLFIAWNFISFQAHEVDEEIMTSTDAVTVALWLVRADASIYPGEVSQNLARSTVRF